MNLNDDVVYRCLRLGPLHQRHPGRSAAWSVTTIAFTYRLLVSSICLRGSCVACRSDDLGAAQRAEGDQQAARDPAGSVGQELLTGVDVERVAENSYWLSANLPNAVLLTYPNSGHGSLFQFHEAFTRQAGGIPGL